MLIVGLSLMDHSSHGKFLFKAANALEEFADKRSSIHTSKSRMTRTTLGEEDQLSENSLCP